MKSHRFVWKKLDTWKIGFTIWTVHVAKTFPKKYRKDKEIDETMAICDEELKEIHMLEACIASPEFFLENLWHEIGHALKTQNSVSYQEIMREVLKNNDQIEIFDDLLIDQEGFRNLDFIFDNIENHQYILDYFKFKSKQLKRIKTDKK